MESGSSQVPDIASILQTLRAYAPTQATVPSIASDLEDGEYDPSQYDPSQALRANVRESPLSAPTKISSTTQLPSTPCKPVPSPSASGITTWPKALNYTVQHIFCSAHKKERIRHLIETQHAHERQWWASRNEIIRKAKGRDKSRMQLDNVLASVGGLVATNSHLQGEAEGDDASKELVVFDRKVHRACRDMMNASNKELSELGLPFYCAGDSGRIEEKELAALRKKMLELLEDYCSHQDENG